MTMAPAMPNADQDNGAAASPADDPFVRVSQRLAAAAATPAAPPAARSPTAPGVTDDDPFTRVAARLASQSAAAATAAPAAAAPPVDPFHAAAARLSSAAPAPTTPSTPEPTDASQSWLGSNARSAFKSFNTAVAEVRKGIGVDYLDRKLNDTFIGKGTKTPDQKYMEDVNSIPTNPNVNNTAGRVVGAAAPIIGAALANPVAGVSVGVAQGSGSAQLEGEREGWTAGQTAGVALERGAFNAALSLIPGGAATGGGAKAVAVEGVKALAKTAAINVGQAGIEAKLKGDLGIKTDDEWHAMLRAAESGDQWAQAALFAGVHATATALNRAPSSPTAGETPATPPAAPVADAAASPPPPSPTPTPPPPTHETLVGRLAAKYPDLKGNELAALAGEMRKPAAPSPTAPPAAKTPENSAAAPAPSPAAPLAPPATPSPERVAELEAAADRSLAAQKAQRSPGIKNPGPKSASDMLLATGKDDGLFPNDAERTGDTRAAVSPDAARDLTPSQKQQMRGMVSEDRASDNAAGKSAEQMARDEAATVARFGATKAEQVQQAIEHYKNHPDPSMRMLAVQAEAEGTGAKQTVPPTTFSDGDKFTIGGRPFRVELDADGGMTFHDDDVTIPGADTLGKVKVDRGSIQRAPEAAVPEGDFAPAKTTGPQGSLLGDRYEGSGNGSRTGSMFGDVRAGPASELEAKGNEVGQAKKDNETAEMFEPAAVDHSKEPWAKGAKKGVTLDTIARDSAAAVDAIKNDLHYSTPDSLLNGVRRELVRQQGITGNATAALRDVGRKYMNIADRESGQPLHDVNLLGKTLVKMADKASENFGPGAAATNDPNFRRENPGSIPPPPETPRTASTKEPAKPPAARWVDRITSSLRQGLDSARRYTGKFLPTHSDLNPAAAAAAAEYMSAPEIAAAQKAIATRRVLGEQPVGSTLDRLVNSVILEDGLRGDRAKFQERQVAAQREHDAAVKAVQQETAFGHPVTDQVKAAKIAELTAGYHKTIEKLGKHEDGVKTIIGDPSHELPTEEAYEKAKADPEVQRALTAHRSYVMPESEAYYRQEAKIADSVDVPVRGRDTDTYLTRKPIRPDDSGGGAVNRPGTRERSSGLAQTAYGNAEQYANTYSENVAHQFDRQTLPALQSKYHQALIENGDAAYGPAGAAPRATRTGQPWPGYEVKPKGNTLTADGEPAFIKPKAEMIYVRPELAKEFERVEGIADKVQRGGVVKGFADMSNSIAMMSTAEPTSHLLNHIAQLLKITVHPGENQGILSKIGVKEANAANLPFVRALSVLERIGPKLVQMAMHDPRVLEQELEAARVAGLQPESQVQGSPIGKAVGRLISQPGLADNRLVQMLDPFAWVSKGVGAFTKAARLVGLDAFHAAVDAGVAQDTPVNKADFLSQFTQYHHEAQPQYITLARKTGLGPFASASQNFLIQRFKGLLGSPNFEATSNLQAVRARAVTAATAWSSLIAIGLANYALWGTFKPKGTPAGAFVYGQDKEGRYKYLNVAQWQGARPAGVSQFTDAMLDHATLQQAIDKGAAGFAQGAIAPYDGPAIRAGFVAVTGKGPLSSYDDAGRVEPGSGETQIGRNIRTAARELNPSVGTLTDDSPGAGGPEKLLGAFAPRVGRNPDSVPDSQAEALAAQMAGLPVKNTPQTPDTKAKAALKADLLRQLRQGSGADVSDPFARAASRLREDGGQQGAAAVDKAVADGQLTTSEAAALTKKAGMGALEWHLRSLSPEDAGKVYDVATLSEKARIHDQVRDKIAKSKLSPAQQDNLFATHGIEPPQNLDVRREYQSLEQKRMLDQQRKERIASLVQQINAADSRQDRPAMDSLRRDRTALATQPKALAGDDMARFQRLQPLIERMNRVEKMVKEGALTKEEGEKRLAELGKAARG